jgi:glycosyltransferase involved in cell wall biosynthesis
MKKIKSYKVMIFIDHFWPGFKAGGPTQSIKNLVSIASSEVEFLIFTRNHDFLSNEKYETIQTNQWNHTKFGKVFYASPKFISIKKIASIINSTNPTHIYLNSFFSRLVMRVIFLKKFLVSKEIKFVLCPRGELNSSALRIKKIKKFLFINLCLLFNIHKKLTWHATNQQEKAHIRDIFGLNVKIKLASNLSPSLVPPSKLSPNLEKNKGELKIVFLGRVHPIKNLLFLLNCIEKLDDSKISLAIIGPIENKNYWKSCKQKINSIRSTHHHVKIQYLGAIAHEKIYSNILDSHFLALPTKGENFGHSIFEFFSASRPVIISDQTPWQNLEDIKCGFDVSLSSHHNLINALSKAIEMNNENWQLFCKESKRFADLHQAKALKASLELFT